MAFMSNKVRGVIRLIAAEFVVLTGIENGSKAPVSFLWSGSEKHLAYFQNRIFGSNAVTTNRIGRRPMTMLNGLLSKFDCSFGATILQRDVVPLFKRPGDFSLPLWVNCDVELSAERTYAKSESMRGDLRKIRNNQLTWTVSNKSDDFEYFFEKIYLPTVISSHGRAALLLAPGSGSPPLGRRGIPPRTPPRGASRETRGVGGSHRLNSFFARFCHRHCHRGQFGA